MFHKWLLKDLLQIRFKSLEVATNQFPRAINHSRFHFSFSHPLPSLHLCASLSIWWRGLNALYGPIILANLDIYRLFHPTCSGNSWILFLQEQISTVISSPLEVYKRFVSMTLRPLSLTVTKTSPGPYQVFSILGDNYFDCSFAPKVAQVVRLSFLALF